MSKQRPGVDENGRPILTIGMSLDESPQLISPCGPDPITSLKIVAATNTSPTIAHSLRERTDYIIGNAKNVDIALPDPRVSRRHCAMKKYGSHFVVRDLESTNGTWFDGERRADFQIAAGDTFSVGQTLLLAVNDKMAAARDELDEILGRTADESSDILLRDIVAKLPAGSSPRHFAITGEPETEERRLAQLIHDTSTWASRPPVVLEFPIPAVEAEQLAVIARCMRTTVIVKLAVRQPRSDPEFWAKLFHPASFVRVIIMARDRAAVRRELESVRSATVRDVVLAPLHARVPSGPEMLDDMWKRRKSRLRWRHLTWKNQAAIRAEWPRSLTKVRETAEHLIRIANDHHQWDTRSWAKRADVVGVPESTLHDWYQRLRISEPLLDPLHATWMTLRKPHA